jgi:DNA-binding NtrC family response regulator
MAASVLVVQPEIDALELMVSALRAAGFDVAGCSDPMMALNVIESDSTVRVLVTRMNFGTGKLNGVALTRMLRHNTGRAINVVFVGQEENRHYAEEDEGEFFPHPIDAGALVDAVGRMLAASNISLIRVRLPREDELNRSL